ncbi:unnamed protein product [Peniophora sp. CBMAI 1063]|nr:unnamed protein product [Peniophora sp. CBMAI 1063]
MPVQLVLVDENGARPRANGDDGDVDHGDTSQAISAASLLAAAAPPQKPLKYDEVADSGARVAPRYSDTAPDVP